MMKGILVAGLSLSVWMLTAAEAQEHQHAPGAAAAVQLMTGLGNYHHPITTASRDRAKTADEYVKKAQALAPNGSERERAYIQALATRYSSDPNADLKKLQVDYKDAMAAFAQRFPDDLDAQTLYAESLMDLRPWQLWSIDGKPSEVTAEVMRVLEGCWRRIGCIRGDRTIHRGGEGAGRAGV